MRTCSTCKNKKPFSEFHLKGDGYRYKCKVCQTTYIKQHYQLNKKKYKKSALATQNRNRNYIRSIKNSTPCADCNIQYPFYVMDFDHQYDKEFNLGHYHNKGINQIKKEISKCELVCANCHRERTFG